MKILKEIRKFLKRFKNESGYTLLEVAAVVAVTATLAAVAVPVVKDKIMDSKTVAAQENIKNLSGAITQYFGDVGYWPDLGATTGNTAKVLRTSDSPDSVVTDVSTGTGWDISTTPTNTVAASAVLSKNAANRASWKGPYNSAPELKDPWGHPFYVAIEDTMAFPGHENDPNHKTAIFILSAGKNEKIDTTRVQDMQTFASSGDDIVVRVR